MYLCMCKAVIDMYICIHVNTFMDLHIYIHICMHPYCRDEKGTSHEAVIYMCIYIYIFISIYMCIYESVYTCIYAYTCIYMFINACIYIYIFTSIHVYL